MSTFNDTFIHITDLHFWEIVRNPAMLWNKRFLGNINVIYRRRHEFHMEMALPYGEHLASLGIKDLVIGGDFTSTATPNEFRRGRAFTDSLADAGLNVHLLPGNHDVYTFEFLGTQRFKQHLGTYIPTGGYPGLQTLPGGTPLILVPTVCPNWISSAGRISDAEIDATRTLIESAPEGPIVVAGHYPILHETKGYKSARSRQLRNAEAFRAMLGVTGRQILYVAGHVHRFSYTQDDRYPNLQHLTTGAFFLQRRGSACRGAFSIVRIGDSGFEVEWHEHYDSWKGERATLDTTHDAHPDVVVNTP